MGITLNKQLKEGKKSGKMDVAKRVAGRKVIFYETIGSNFNQFLVI
jgi:hypothetical protein